MRYHQPETLDAAFVALQSGGRLVAGATDYFPALGEGLPTEDLIDLTRIDGLRGIQQTDEGWRIGATTTWTDIIQADLPPAFDGLKAAAREVGSIQIQNAGTIAGNLCNASPAADGVPPLLTLDAEIELTGPNARRTLPLGAFITGVRETALAPDEIVSAILIAPVSPIARSSFAKLGARKYLVISIAMVSVLTELNDDDRFEDVRVAVGACSPVAQRLTDLEADLLGRPADVLNDPTCLRPKHFATLSPIEDVRGSVDYRNSVVPELVRRALMEAANG